MAVQFISVTLNHTGRYSAVVCSTTLTDVTPNFMIIDCHRVIRNVSQWIRQYEGRVFGL